MAAARYWRIVSLDSYGGVNLQLSEFGLFDGATRRDTGAVVTSTVAPVEGSLSALNDGEFGTSVTFAATQFRSPGFAIEWDLGSPLEVNVVRLATVSNATAPMVFYVQYMDANGEWVFGGSVVGAKSSIGVLGMDISVDDSVTDSPGSGDPIPLRSSPTASPRSISYYQVPDPTTVFTQRPVSFDREDGGQFRIVGTVKESSQPANLPLRRRVLLIDEVSRRTIRETWSDATTGAYIFNQIAGAPRRYTVVSYDHTGQYRAVIADNLEAEPIP